MSSAPGAADRPSLAVIIVTYQSADVLAECLAALEVALGAAKDHVTLPVDLVVVDNASGVRPVVPASSRWQKYETFVKDNLGFSRGVNRGLALVPDAQRVLLLNPDARLEPPALAELLADLDGTGAAVAGPLLVGQDGNPYGMSERPFHTVWREILRQFAPFLISRRPYGDEARETGDARCLTGACLLIDGAFLRSVGGLDTYVAMYLEDVELCQKSHDSGRRVRLVRSARCGHALGGSSGDENFRVSTGLHLTLLAARLEFIRRHQGRVAAAVARFAMLVGAALRVPIAFLSRRPALAAKHRRSAVWALRSGAPPQWPLGA